MAKTNRTKKRGQRKRKYDRPCTQWMVQGNKSFDNGNVSYAFDTNTPANRYLRIAPTASITTGDRYIDRQSNVIFVKYINVSHTFRNTSIYPRFVRQFLLRVKGAGVVPSSTFTDLLIDASYNAIAPSGLDEDMGFRINQTVYEVLYDRKYMIPGAANTVSGGSATEPPVLTINRTIPVNKYTSYQFNTSAERRGGLIYGIMIAESPNIGIATTTVNHSYQFHLKFGDAYPTMCMGKSKRS